jgi:hypothetical protein
MIKSFVILLSIFELTQNRSMEDNYKKKTKESHFKEKNNYDDIVKKFTQSEDAGKSLHLKKLENYFEAVKVNLDNQKKQTDTGFKKKEDILVTIQTDLQKLEKCDQKKISSDKNKNFDFLNNFGFSPKSDISIWDEINENFDIKKIESLQDEKRKNILNFYIKRFDLEICNKNFDEILKITNTPKCEYDKSVEIVYDSYPLPNLTYLEFLEMQKILKEFFSIFNQLFTTIPPFLVRNQIDVSDSQNIELFKSSLVDFIKNPENLLIINKVINKAIEMEVIFKSVDCGVKNFMNFYYLLMRFYKIYISTPLTYSKDVFLKKVLDLKFNWKKEIIDNYKNNFFFVAFFASLIKESAYQVDKKLLNDKKVIKIVFLIKKLHQIIISMISKQNDYDSFMKKTYFYLTELMQDTERIFEIGIMETKSLDYILKAQNYHYHNYEHIFSIKYLFAFFLFLNFLL